ncbi:hypothetical protein BDU57DRAFT_71954 [Ampelomyces quisqualis]|uniref:Uncharacterized protein n=1 Tax=Ampelomyces quisqualis TaxID=50730 RepID=A0A6A5R5P8_AMPQU|nr:hypothetical protein BDU57DRAFT_71954 [Ampelomyces quisqualis]
MSASGLDSTPPSWSRLLCILHVPCLRQTMATSAGEPVAPSRGSSSRDMGSRLHPSPSTGPSMTLSQRLCTPRRLCVNHHRKSHHHDSSGSAAKLTLRSALLARASLQGPRGMHLILRRVVARPDPHKDHSKKDVDRFNKSTRELHWPRPSTATTPYNSLSLIINHGRL